MSGELTPESAEREENDKASIGNTEDIFNNQLCKPLYPKGRVAKTLCRECNTFLGKYDEAYLKFYNIDGDCKTFKGFQKKTKIEAIKSIFGKFLSVPEANDEQFDFIDFLKSDTDMEYNGKWKIYFIRRDNTTDILGFKDIRTGRSEYDEGVVYELSDEKFIFCLMNFEKHDRYEMTNIFDILNSNYHIVKGDSRGDGYHNQMLLSSLLSESEDDEDV